jgi:hypothetical protein
LFFFAKAVAGLHAASGPMCIVAGSALGSFPEVHVSWMKDALYTVVEKCMSHR